MATLFLLGANPAASAPTPWEYGVFSFGSPNSLEWQDPYRRVLASKVDFFFRQMRLSSGATANVATGALQAMSFHHLGKDGWEPETVTAGTGRDIYGFKRPQ